MRHLDHDGPDERSFRRRGLRVCGRRASFTVLEAVRSRGLHRFRCRRVWIGQQLHDHVEQPLRARHQCGRDRLQDASPLPAGSLGVVTDEEHGRDPRAVVHGERGDASSDPRLLRQCALPRRVDPGESSSRRRHRGVAGCLEARPTPPRRLGGSRTGGGRHRPTGRRRGLAVQLRPLPRHTVI